jgi:NTE family protein
LKTGGSGWFAALSRWMRPPAVEPFSPPKIGLALGGGFARGLAHIGVLRVFEQNQIPVHCITGISAGSIVAAGFASGASSEEIAKVGCSMKFADVARWTICRLGLAGTERMSTFLRRLLKKFQFEEMQIPLGIVATNLATGEPVLFSGSGDVCVPIRASCSYPGLFQPVRYQDQLLVDGAMSMEVPAAQARGLGATHVVSVHLSMQNSLAPTNMFQVVNRCFQIMQARTEDTWRKASDLVIAPDVRGIQWDGFENAQQLIAAGEAAAWEALPQVRAWLNVPTPSSAASAAKPFLTGRVSATD